MDAFKDSKEKYLETLRDTLEQTEELINEKITEVLVNADVVLDTVDGISQEHGITISTALTVPWQNASSFAKTFEGDAMTAFTDSGAAAEAFKTTANLAISGVETTAKGYVTSILTALASPWKTMIGDGSPISTFSTKTEDAIDGALTDAQSTATSLTNFLTQPWKDATSAVNTFSTTAKNALDGVTKKAEEAAKAINTANNVSTPSYDTNKTSVSGNSSTGGTADVKALQNYLNDLYAYYGIGAKVKVDGIYGSDTTSAVKKIQKFLSVTQDGKYGKDTKDALVEWLDSQIKLTTYEMQKHGTTAAQKESYQNSIDKYKYLKSAIPTAIYAKGTLGTKRDQFAITDESWIGEEITLAAGKNGQLQYLKKGSAVMPADISANLVEWGKLNPNMINFANHTSGVNVISGAINKPEINLSFDALVKAERIDENTLPEVKRFVQQEINNLVKQMNYAVKTKGGR